MTDKENRSDCAVRIAVRERPFSSEELAGNVPNGIEKYSDGSNIIIVEDRPFGFDHVFEQTSTQEEVFEAIGRPLVEKMLSGFNCSLLAYGQSGNGKTYTMGLDGQSEIENSAKDAGIIIRTLRSIFETVQADEAIADMKLEVSFIEIYNERVYDLLSATYTEAEKFKKLFTKREMRTEKDAKEILAEAYQRRHVRPTKINLTSSRSHAVFTIYATFKSSDFCSIHSELNLVDLAGAEGVRKTGHHGQALAEGVNINQGLLSVGRILQAIAKGDKVIPYRESVLTRVLQESLNRNCFLTLLACVSPSKLDTKETLSTLRFAENVGTLKNNPKINVIMNEITMARRKTPTKQMFTPRPNSTFKGSKRNTINTNTLKKKVLNFPPSNHNHNNTTTTLTSTARKDSKVGQINRRPSYYPNQQMDTLAPSASAIHARRPTEQDFSFAANISTSTFINHPLDHNNQSQAVNYSPVIRKCMSTFESKLDERISAAVNDIASKLMNNSTFVGGASVVGGATFEGGAKRTSSVPMGQGEPPKQRRRTRNSCQPVEEEQMTFKVPNQVQRTLHRDEDPIAVQSTEPLNGTFELLAPSESSLGAMAFDVSNSTMVQEDTSMLRRSRRVQVLNESRVQREVVERQKRTQEGNGNKELKQKPKKPQFVRNKYLASYFRLSTQMENKEAEEQAEKVVVVQKRGGKAKAQAQNTHSTEVLNLLNNGNLKELQILPQIGLKTAYQIMTFRTTKGKFKSFKDLKKLNWTEKKVERFMKDNYVS